MKLCYHRPVFAGIEMLFMGGYSLDEIFRDCDGIIEKTTLYLHWPEAGEPE